MTPSSSPLKDRIKSKELRSLMRKMGWDPEISDDVEEFTRFAERELQQAAFLSDDEAKYLRHLTAKAC